MVSGSHARGRWFSLLLAVSVMATLVTMGVPGAVGAPRDDEVVVAFDKEPDTLNPYSTNTLSAKELNVVEGFHVTNDNMQHVPRIVQRVPSLTNAGLTMTAGKMTVTWRDRKSTRLNSSHGYISYTLFFFNDPAPTEISPLSLHAALPISPRASCSGFPR